MEYGLGRREEWDPRNEEHLLRPRTLSRLTIVRGNRFWPLFRYPLNQGPTGTCVTHAAVHRLLGSPVVRTVKHVPDPFDLYRTTVLYDGWADNDREATLPNADLQAGTSGVAVMRALKDMGLISAYEWSQQVDDLIDALCALGPVMIGVNWYSSMFDTDAKGFLHIDPNAVLVGGHEICLNGWNETGGYAWGLQSWGNEWPESCPRLRGRFKIDRETLVRLIEREGGDIVTPTEVKP